MPGGTVRVDACARFGGVMQLKYQTILLGTLAVASQALTGAAQAQTALEPVIVEGAGTGTATSDGGAPAASTDNNNPATQIDGYVAGSTATGTKTNTPLREVPQSISVVTRDQIDDRGAKTLNEAVGYSAGVAINPYGFDHRHDQFIIRGFEQNTTGVYRDGLRLPTFGFAGFRTEPYGVDHIDVLRGPTSTLYGPNNPGGLLNIVSKKPPEQAFGEVWASYGTHEAKTVGFDVGAPFDNGKFSYRVTGLLRDADTQVDYVENDRVYIAPSFTFRPTDATTFTLMANYQKDTLGDSLQLLPAEAVKDGSIDRDTFLGEPDFSKMDGEQWGVGYQFEHKFDPAWTVRQNLRYDHSSVDYRSIFPAGTIGPGSPLPLPPLPENEVIRGALTADETLDLFQVDTSLEHKSRFDRVENTLLVGLDYAYLEHNGTQSQAGVVQTGYPFLNNDGFNVLKPVYGQYYFIDPNTLAPGGLIPSQDHTLTQENIGLYLQDQIKIDKKWVVTLSGRYDLFDSEFDNHLAGTKSDQREEAFTYRTGLNYLFDNGLTPYVSYATSFVPVPLTGSAGQPLNPEEGEQIEAGVKYQPKGFKSWGQISVFDLTRQNVTQADPANIGQYLQVGEVQVQGVEVEATLDFDNGWKVLGAYSYWDAEITKDSLAANEGNRPARIPEQIASLWVDYTFGYGPLKGFGLGAGVRHVSDTFGDNANLHDVPSYTLVDGAIRYEEDNWFAGLSVKNVFDEDYAATCGSVASVPGLTPYDYCSYGEGRTATLKIGYRW